MFDLINHKQVTRTNSVTKEHFVTDYKNTSTPVILSQLMHDWPATKKWDFDYLNQVAGDNIVPVYSSKPATGKEHQHAATKQIPLSEYLLLLKTGEKDLRLFFYNILANIPSLINDFSYPDIGLKFFKKLPVLFMGGKGAKVQMHYDIDFADLLLCHFGGRKKVLLIPPEQSEFMYKVPFSFSALHNVDFSEPDLDKHPALKHLNAYVAELNHGEALYIPPGFWHYIIYQDAGFSMTLRALPTSAKHRITLLKNIVITRTIEGMMRKLVGQKWNDRNERLAIEKTHKRLNTIRSTNN